MTFGRLNVAIAALACCLIGLQNAAAQTGRSTFGQPNRQGAFGQGGSAFQRQGAGLGAGRGGFGNAQRGLGRQQQFGGNRGQFNQGRFVGGSAEDVRQQMRAMFGLQRRNRFMNFQIENLNQQRRSQRQRQGQNQEKPQVRVQLRPNFEYPQLSTAAVSANLQTSLSRILDQHHVETLLVEIADRTATLKGRVADAEQRALLEKLVAMEPGVSQVENLLEVDTATGAETPTGR